MNLSAESLEYVQGGAPFAARSRAAHRPEAPGWMVRSRIGEDVALVEDEIVATAIAEALNLAAVPGARGQVSGESQAALLPNDQAQRPGKGDSK